MQNQQNLNTNNIVPCANDTANVNQTGLVSQQDIENFLKKKENQKRNARNYYMRHREEILARCKEKNAHEKKVAEYIKMQKTFDS